ncbi:MAG: hypothetical protein Tsb0021_18370 [Chlamydiales bacterium]
MELRAYNSSLIPFLRYIMTGVFVCSVHYSILILLVEWINCNATLSTSVGFVVGSTINYLLQKYWTFRSDIQHSRSAGRYCLVSAIALVCNMFLFWTLSVGIGVWYLYSQFVTTIMIAVLNFFLNQHFTFNNSLVVSVFRQNFAFTCHRGMTLVSQALGLTILSIGLRFFYLFLSEGRVVTDRSYLFSLVMDVFLILGFNEESAQLLSSLIPGALLILPVVFTGRQIYTDRIALIAGLLAAFHPRLIQLSCNGSPDMLSLFLLTVGICGWTVSLHRDQLSWMLIPSGVCFAFFSFSNIFGWVPFLCCTLIEGVKMLTSEEERIGKTLQRLGIVLGTYITVISVNFSLWWYHLPHSIDEVFYLNFGVFYQNIEALFDLLPQAVMSPIFFFMFILPILSARKHLEIAVELPLLIMLIYPLALFLTESTGVRGLLPLLVPLNIFGAAGIAAFCSYINTEVLLADKMKARYVVAPILILNLITLVFALEIN